MSQYICLMKPTNDPRSSSNYVETFKQHGAYLQKSAVEGQLIFAGYTDGENPGSLSLAVISAPDLQSAQNFAKSAPAVSVGLLSVEVEPFEVFVARELQG